MLETFVLSLYGVGAMILYFILPIAVVIGLGLLVVGVLRRRFGAAVFGVVLPLGVLIAASAMSSTSQSPEAVASGSAISFDMLGSIMPIAYFFAAAILIVAVLPMVFRAVKH